VRFVQAKRRAARLEDLIELCLFAYGAVDFPHGESYDRRGNHRGDTDSSGVVDRPVALRPRCVRMARAATPEEALLDSAAILLGIVRARPGYSEPEALLSHLGHTLDALLTALERVSPKLDVGVEQSVELSAVPKLTKEAGRAVEAALRLVSAYDAFGDGKMHVPHLFGGVLRGSQGAKGRQALRAVLRGAAAAANNDYDAFLRELVRNRSMTYADFLTRRPLLPPSALPPPPELFVDREGELKNVLALVAEGSWVIITGPPASARVPSPFALQRTPRAASAMLST
jgi:hypothetical protein